MMLSLALLIALQAPAPSPVPPTDSDPPGRVARLSVREGRVSFQPSGDTAASSWSAAVLNYTLTSGDRLYADQDARAELEAGDCTVRLGTATDLTIVNLTDDFLQVSMSSGTLRVTVYDLSHGDSIEVDTPNGAFLLRQAGAYRVDVSEPDRTTTIRVDSGLAVDRWSAGRDAPLAASVSAQYVGRNVPGYEARCSLCVRCGRPGIHGVLERDAIYGLKNAVQPKRQHGGNSAERTSPA